MLVVKKPQLTPKPNVDKDVHASASAALTCVQGNEPIEELQGEEMVSTESIMLEGAHDVILEANEFAFDQPSMVHEDKQFAKVEKVDNIVLPMVQDQIMIPHIDFIIPEEFDMVEFKVFLFFMLPKVIPDLKQVLLVNILILQRFRTRGDSTRDWAKKKEEAAPFASMASRPRNSKGANVPPSTSKPMGKNEVASKQRNEVPLVDHKVVSRQRREMREPDPVV
ncbi:hypothetical protein SO802_007724 [Lithocarpus litseifolius]|uniref:Uncharacterized protein n=1 Tax=Lithocarpus litseifolius TaxID=425828 RepID=A0AAW2DUG9_9ROSI